MIIDLENAAICEKEVLEAIQSGVNEIETGFNDE